MTSVYFAYGSNMSSDRLLARVAGARVLGPARLADFALVFDKPSRDGSAKANIVRRERGLVWGVAWSLDVAGWTVLDGFEPGYTRTACRIELAEPGRPGHVRTEITEAITYVYDGPRSRALPFDWYLGHLARGAEEHGLPAPYRQALERTRAAPDPGGRERR